MGPKFGAQQGNKLGSQLGPMSITKLSPNWAYQLNGPHSFHYFFAVWVGTEFGGREKISQTKFPKIISRKKSRFNADKFMMTPFSHALQQATFVFLCCLSEIRYTITVYLFLPKTSIWGRAVETYFKKHRYFQVFKDT